MQTSIQSKLTLRNVEISLADCEDLKKHECMGAINEEPSAFHRHLEVSNSQPHLFREVPVAVGAANYLLFHLTQRETSDRC